ncbi:amino acid ABC transporter ATP-binding protein [Frigoribacterium sp. PhB24]|uniref:amino acid ABC transporter ATP-binding protein n=1 Tax=Frigoribacterium sp. PhB24 TaxID=2485204 RepID=UPI000F4A3E63|nr:amino acid ABC transporter ATP-binding protein [Frigoribacterium sp. PhB24]ROS54710.1 amino acid ABC transporter ATP-binding protein (PAAT family) [Frigoribacterium sp. PhB24]
MSTHTPDPTPGGAVPATPAVTGPETVEPPATARHPEIVLRLDGVRKSFGDTVVLDGIDLDVARDEVVALIGASGSGKSTLLRTVNLLERVDDGRIVLGDDDITDPRVRVDAVRARIGVVFQHFNLFPHLTVLDNVALASRHVLRQPKAAANERALEVLTRVGLGDKAGAYPDRLSGGQQQRVAIARALAPRPAVLLLDEITSALDPELVGEVLDLVRTLKEVGTTILMATHEMAFARDVADRVVFLDRGRIAEQGPPAQLFTAPREARTREFLTRFTAP